MQRSSSMIDTMSCASSAPSSAATLCGVGWPSGTGSGELITAKGDGSIDSSRAVSWIQDATLMPSAKMAMDK
eukprot:15445022-Alexandrium_andersonii.AAC.1